MSFIVALLLSVLAVEILFRIPLLTTARNVMAASRNSLRVIQSKRIPDEKKQKYILAYSGRSFVNTFLLAVELGVILLAVGGVFWVFAKLLKLDMGLIYDPAFLVAMTVFSVVYAIVRKRFA